ncbi:hypothetical protein F6X51_14850 [Methylobacterium planeticum]|uniref:O-antigen ligase family protein n=2 Tax=Methylobacterium planeticum TaxID=2615211 RepID=A0A6N6MMU0_9HYPH|nr:hypothetical protein F6X51_14850 [Methylobacterium planeticum]
MVASLLILAVSGGMLWAVGLNYDGLTGGQAQKVHPASYLCVLLVLWQMLRRGNPVANLVSAAEHRPASCLLAAASIAMAAQIILRGASGTAGAIDTFLQAALVMILLLESDARSLRRLETLVHAVMAANAVLGIVEFATGQRFFPFRLDGATFETDTRSAALQGHPLGNATLTACYVLALIAGGGSLKPLTRLVMIAVQLVALVTFGGRSAIVVTLVLGGAFGLAQLLRAIARGRIPLLAAAGAACALPLVATTVAGLAYGGFFDALLGRFASDGGSANARVAMFDLFSRLPLRDLILGPDPSLVDSLRRITGLEWGIENPIIRVVLYQGALMALLLTTAVTLFLVEVGRRCRAGIAMPMIAFVVLINTFESLGGKTTLLAKFVIVLVALYRPFPETRIARAS